MHNTTTMNEKEIRSHIARESVLTWDERELTNEEETSGAIICTADLASLRLVNAALRAWELRNGFAVLLGIALLSLGSVSAHSPEADQAQINADRVAQGIVADDESPCGPYILPDDCFDIGDITEETE